MRRSGHLAAIIIFLASLVPIGLAAGLSPPDYRIFFLLFAILLFVFFVEILRRQIPVKILELVQHRSNLRSFSMLITYSSPFM